jgi:hypothetical protein
MIRFIATIARFAVLAILVLLAVAMCRHGEATTTLACTIR